MTIHELLAEFSAADIVFQRIDESLGNVKTTKHGEAVTFYTNQLSPASAIAGTGPMGLVIWIPRDRWDALARKRGWNARTSE